MAGQRAGGLGRKVGRWLDRRIPPDPRVTLSQRNVFIFPTRTALAFALLLALLTLGAINYQNALVYGVAFLLGAMFLVTILHTFRNLSGITLELLSAKPGFVGEDIGFRLRLTRPPGRARRGLRLGWPGALMRWVEIDEDDSAEVELYVRANRRGWFNPGRLLVETRYPLGLLRAWTWVDLDARALVYPAPRVTPLPPPRSRTGEEGALMDPVGADDFSGLRDYEAGDPVRHILWRQYARNEALVVKEYVGFVEPRSHFDLDAVHGHLEEQLGQLAGWVVQARDRGLEFSLGLPGNDLAAGAGDAHAAQALRRLALFGLPEAPG